jgi:DNA-directed RNA polymerase subunit RPC12/RpoP
MEYTIVLSNRDTEYEIRRKENTTNCIQIIISGDGNFKIVDYNVLGYLNVSRDMINKICTDIIMEVILIDHIEIYEKYLTLYGKTEKCLSEFGKEFNTLQFPIKGNINVDKIINKYLKIITMYSDEKKVFSENLSNPTCYKCGKKGEYITTFSGEEKIRCFTCNQKFISKNDGLPPFMWNSKKI